MTRRPELVAFAAALDGLSANPAGDRARYLDLIAPNETPERAAEMAAMWGCALVARGILRGLGVQHPILAAPYRDRHAMSDLVEIARDAGALHGAERTPEPGDMVVIGGGDDGGGAEHVWTVVEVLGGGRYRGVDGGQRDAAGAQVVREREHVLAGGWDTAHDDGAGGGARRSVRYVIDVEKVLEAFGTG